MTGLDILVLLLVGGGLALGLLKGFVGEVLSLFAWVAAIIALKLLHGPVSSILVVPVGSNSGAAVLAFAIVFGFVFAGGKMFARRLGSATMSSAVGPVDRVLGGGFGALKGLIIATLLYLAANLFYDVIWGRESARPEWMAQSRTYPLLHASSRAIVDFIETRRNRRSDERLDSDGDNALTNEQE